MGHIRSAFTGTSRWRRCRRGALLALSILTVGVVLSACGGPSTPGVVSGSASTTTTSASSPSRTGSQGTGLLAYSTCMRDHGVTNFPDPSAGGGIDKEEVVNALNAVSAATSNSAQHDCAHLVPANGGLSGQSTQPVTAQDQHYYLRAVACMRAHGFPTFPDPIFSNGGVSLPPTPSINTQSPQYARAAQICKKLIPAGLPESGNQ